MKTTPEQPAPLHVITNAIADWVSRLGAVWVEGQLTEIKQLKTASDQVFLKVRDLDKKASMTLVTSPQVIRAMTPEPSDGARVVMHVKAEFWSGRGDIVLRAREIRNVGIGDLLARIELLKKQLSAEGLFSADRKKDLPFLPQKVGLVCGRDSAAMRDVVENARRRWPAIEFEIHEVQVQGSTAAFEVAAAVRRLDQNDQVDVIVIARGGGSVEDLLPFSDEELVRTVGECQTPTVSAIGHEQDAPLLDYVADYRASTPTDAARRIVPDLAEESSLIVNAQARTSALIRAILDREQHQVRLFAQHPALANPIEQIVNESRAVDDSSARSSRALAHILSSASESTSALTAQLRALSPGATLARGYAVLESADGHVVREAQSVAPGDVLKAQVAQGEFDVVVSYELTSNQE